MFEPPDTGIDRFPNPAAAQRIEFGGQFASAEVFLELVQFARRKWQAREVDDGGFIGLEQAIERTDDLPDSIFGRKREAVKEIRRRYEALYKLLLRSGLRITEALSLRVRHCRVVGGTAYDR